VLIHGIVVKHIGQVRLLHDLHPRPHLLHILHYTRSNISIIIIKHFVTVTSIELKVVRVIINKCQKINQFIKLLGQLTTDDLTFACIGDWFS
jgi:hypothetical protein